jgi:two-component system, NarL family, nitrate/nitrite response regulator NarL
VIRVFILSDVRLYREGLKELLGRGNMEVVGAEAQRRLGVGRICELSPDVALIDTAMPDALVAVRSIRATAPRVRIVALSVSESEPEIVACAEAGVSGYVTRDDSVADLVAALQSVERGEMLASPHLAATLLRRVTALAAERADGSPARLTQRELEIVQLIHDGLSNKEIARRLYIELPTVKNHVHNILKKLGVPGRAEAAARVMASAAWRPRQRVPAAAGGTLTSDSG